MAFTSNFSARPYAIFCISQQKRRKRIGKNGKKRVSPNCAIVVRIAGCSSHYLHMPRRNRCIVPGVPCHVTQRGVDRRETFSANADRRTYLRLLRHNLGDAEASLPGWRLMTNHVHLILTPGREDSLAVLLRRLHGRYAQYYNARHARSGTARGRT
jgi:REP element-mobilizing transposase RayT